MLSMRRYVSLFVATVVGGWAGCRPSDPPEASAAADRDVDVVATVAGQTIRRDALRQELQRRLRPGAEPRFSKEEKLAALDRLIDQEALYAAATAAGFDRTPEMQRRIRRLVVGYFKEKELPTTNGVVDAGEIRAFYEANKNRYAVPAAVRAAVLFVSVPRTTPAEKARELRGKAEDLLRAARGATNAAAFSALAASHSDHRASRYRGGELGWLSRESGGVEPELVEALFALTTPGEFAPLVATTEGFYVAKLIEKREAGFKPLDSVESSIGQQLARDKAGRAERELYASARAGLDVRIHDDRVDEVTVPTPDRVLPAASGASNESSGRTVSSRTGTPERAANRSRGVEDETHASSDHGSSIALRR
ncbi:MAG: peptidyl-prolyl cis-trans isomerase [Verrucomicrobiales bacterium]|nr:peptidyl-prolyl cis-trans isomerase [Verrucomicrobiales bacterium]